MKAIKDVAIKRLFFSFSFQFILAQKQRGVGGGLWIKTLELISPLFLASLSNSGRLLRWAGS